MPQTPLTLYRSLLACVGKGSEHDRRAALRKMLRDSPETWPTRLRATMDGAGITRDYVTRHLLSIGKFEPDVLEALEAGLPLRVCRLVNGLPSEADREQAMAAFWQAKRAGASGALLPRGVSTQVERAARRLRARQVSSSHAAATTSDLEGGWLLPAPEPARPLAPPGHVWTFRTQRRSDRTAERLPHQVVEALVATYLQQGDRLVDVTAGAGTIGQTAQRFGISSWSGDIEPGAAFVHRIDAREAKDSRGVFGEGPETKWPPPRCAQALVVHPPTYLAWVDQQDEASRALATIDGYAEDVAAMLAGSLDVVAPGGNVWIITRPVREKGRVWLVTSHLSELLTEFEFDLVGYHVAADNRGRDFWHVLVGRCR